MKFGPPPLEKSCPGRRGHQSIEVWTLNFDGRFLTQKGYLTKVQISMKKVALPTLTVGFLVRVDISSRNFS
jgi:hypothetical protein